MHNIINLKSNPSLKGMAEIIPSVTFSSAGGKELKMELIVPWWDRENKKKEPPKYPLVVFVQGSGWTFPNVWYEVPQLCALASRGYAVASITHRNSLENAPYPACLEDVKTAIRFLRKNADSYGIDCERVGIWGTSSGGNLALLAAMTMDESEFKTDEFREFSDSVKFVVSCFPTTDMVELYNNRHFDQGLKDVFTAISGGSVDDNMTVLKKMSPFYLASENKNYPPILLAHGTADMLVPYSQSTKMYQRFLQCGADVTMVSVENAPHEGSFWSIDMINLIFRFIEEHI